MAFSDALIFAFKRIKPFITLSPRRIHSSRNISEESISLYRPGGYHPVRIGDVFNGRYKVLNKLGHGLYSTVWLARNLDETKVGKGPERHVALKALRADSLGTQHDTFELDILRREREVDAITAHLGRGHILGLLDDFKHRGPNGDHACFVFKATGPDMSIYRRLFPKLRISLPLLKQASRQLLLGLSYLHDACRVIHTDIKPQNILIETPAINEMFEKAPSHVFQPHGPPLKPPNDFYMESTQVSSSEDITQPKELSVRLGDFGSASWFGKHLTEWIQPDKLRAPEVILGADWDHKVDIWNLGLIIWELAEGSTLFDGMWSPNADYTAEAHLAQMNAVLGDMPRTLLARSKNRARYFDVDGRLHKLPAFPPCSLETFSKNPDISDGEREQFLDSVKAMTQLDPDERSDASELLQSAWLRT